MAQAREQRPTQDPAQPEHPDSKILVGGPGQDDPPQPEPKPQSEPSTVEVTIGGRRFALNPETAQALAQRERDFDRRLNEQSQELGQLRRMVQPPKEQPDGRVDYDTLLFERPTEALRKFRDEITNDLRQQYTQEQSIDKFWRGFYARHKDLDPEEDDFMVKAVLQRNYAELASLPSRQAQDRIADITREEILRLSQKFRPEDERTTSRAVAESASPVRQTVKPEPEDEGPKSLSEVINKRRKMKFQKPRAA